MKQASTLGELKKSGYVSKTIKQEIRENLIAFLQEGKETFPGIHGYEDTVIPDMERAMLSQHNVLLLGLRGQAKTRVARMMTRFLDEYVPVVEGSPLNDDPFNPISNYAIELISKHGDETPITWWHREKRFVEKLATPDTSMADLIGDIDPIKAANLRVSLSDEQVIHYGLMPRSNRAIFVINELPDLQARIQVSLFNILQEGDIQIRGFTLRIPLDIQFVFTANPEDYTNRGSIVTPLKDRIESQILTHYPTSAGAGIAITKQEALINTAQVKKIICPELLHQLIEQIAIEARNSEYVDKKSGVSARLTIAALENLYASAERRMLLNGEKNTCMRMSDLYGVLQAITGKIELVYEGEQEGSGSVALMLVSKAIRTLFVQYFPDPDKFKKLKNAKDNIYANVVLWFGINTLNLGNTSNSTDYAASLSSIDGLSELVGATVVGALSDQEKLLWMEFVLHGLAEYSLIAKTIDNSSLQFGDILSALMSGSLDDLEDEDY
jgi:magnesium chelatase subunit I